MAVAHGGAPGTGVFLRGLLVVAGSQVAVGALNDYLDRFDDRRTQPDKPLPAGLTSPSIARWLVVAGMATCIGFALSFGPVPFLVAVVGLGGGLAYDLGLKRSPFSPAAYVVSFLSLVTWIWLIVGTLTWKMIPVYPIGASLLVAAHLANALPDIESDRALGQRGLAVVLGPRRTFQAIMSMYGVVAVPAAGLSIAQRSLPALTLVVIGSALAATAGWIGAGPALSRPRRQVVFRLMAPAIGLLGGGCLLAFTAVA
jgi:4-hydroxybenzoate polyprenyltransferase